MKRIVTKSLIAASTALLVFGCKNVDASKVSDKLAELEKRVEKLEARPASPQRPAMAAPSQESAYVLPVGSSYVQGNKAAPVTVMVFTDYQCPFCAKVDPMLATLMNDPEMKDKVNVVYKHYPLSFHKEAKPASKAALAAGEQGNDKFFAMSDKIFQNQGALLPENFVKWAKEIGLDVTKFSKDLKDNDAKYDGVIKTDTELAINVANVRGTPSLFVSGWELRERSVDGIKNIIRDKKLLSVN